MTPAQKAGVVVGQEYVVTGKATHRFNIGEKYTLTKDATMSHHVSIHFKGDLGSDRMRPAKHYQLVTTDLV